MCVMCFSPSRAVLSAILRDEYLTSAVRTPSLVLWAIYQNSENKPRGCRGLYFSKALFEGLIYGGKFGFNFDWATLINGRKFTVFAMFSLYLREISSTSPPAGLHLEGRFNRGFFALRVWGG